MKKKRFLIPVILILLVVMVLPSFGKKRKGGPPKVREKVIEKVEIREIVKANFAISYDVFTKSFRSHTLQLPGYEHNYFLPHPVGIVMKLSHDDIFMRLGFSIPTHIGKDTRGKSLNYGIFETEASFEYFSAGLFHQNRGSFYYGFEFVKGNFIQDITYSRFIYYQDPYFDGPGTITLKNEIKRWNLVIGWSPAPPNIGIEFGFNIATEIGAVKQFGLAFPPELYDVDFPRSYLRINIWL